jgi:S1-C subfamily serine protease
MGDLLAKMDRAGEAGDNYRRALQAAESVLATDGANAPARQLRLSSLVKLGLDEAEVVILGVAPGSQAQQFGVSRGDVILRYAGERVVNADKLASLIASTKGARIELDIRRDGRPLRFIVKEGGLGMQCEDRSTTGQRSP